MNTLLKNFIITILILLALGGIFSVLYIPLENVPVISITKLVEEINQDKIQKITVAGEDLSVIYKDGQKAT